MLNFFAALAGHDKVADAGKAATCGRNFKTPSLQIKSTKNEGPPEDIGFNAKKVRMFEKKNITLLA